MTHRWAASTCALILSPCTADHADTTSASAPVVCCTALRGVSSTTKRPPLSYSALATAPRATRPSCAGVTTGENNGGEGQHALSKVLKKVDWNYGKGTLAVTVAQAATATAARPERSTRS